MRVDAHSRRLLRHHRQALAESTDPLEDLLRLRPGSGYRVPHRRRWTSGAVSNVMKLVRE